MRISQRAEPLRTRHFRAAALAGLLVAGISLPLAAAPPERRWTTVERLSTERLAAAHRDVLKHRSRVEQPAPLPGLEDFRAIFHAHAGDAAHTGGTPEEMLADAKRAAVRIVFLSDHYRPPRDFMDGWRGLRDGVLFIPGSEAGGFLLHPEASVVQEMDAGDVGLLVAAVSRGAGLAFLSHVEDRAEHSLDGLAGMEIYNRHADAKDDARSMRALVEWMTDPDDLERLEAALRLYPEEVFAAQLDYPALYLERWDRETTKRRVVGVAANDCHHNQVFVVKKVDDSSVRVGTVVDRDDQMRIYTAEQRPELPEMTRGRAPGDLLARLDFDPYWVAMRNTSTHVLVSDLSETAVRSAVAEGHVYVAHDWMADPTGFRFIAQRADGEVAAILGDEVSLSSELTLIAELSIECYTRLLRDGVELSSSHSDRVEHAVDAPGVYRVESWLEVDGELRPWLYSNPIYVRAAPSLTGRREGASG